MSSRYHVHPIERRARGLPCGYLTTDGPCELESMHQGEHFCAIKETPAAAKLRAKIAGMSDENVQKLWDALLALGDDPQSPAHEAPEASDPPKSR